MYYIYTMIETKKIETMKTETTPTLEIDLKLIEKMNAYKPQTTSFPFHTLHYLKRYGESKNEDIREHIGLNAWSKDSRYSDRSSYHFALIVTRLINRNCIVRTKLGYYKITEKGITTIS